MDQARINSFQYSQLTSSMLRGAPLSTDLPSPAMQSRVPLHKRVKPIRPSKNSTSTGLRTYQDIVDSGAYRQPDYQPRPTKVRTEQEKDRLAHFMAYRSDPNKRSTKPVESSSPTRELDRFDELVLEVEERQLFLEQMTICGKRREYQPVIANEIADKVREMEYIDRQRSKALEQRLQQLSSEDE